MSLEKLTSLRNNVENTDVLVTSKGTEMGWDQRSEVSRTQESSLGQCIYQAFIYHLL